MHRCACLALVALLGCAGRSGETRPFATAEISVAAAPASSPAPIKPLRPAGRPGDVVDGFGGLHVGDTRQQIEAILGPPSGPSVSETVERQGWIDSGYDPGQEPVFAIGFDEVSSYESDRLPVFKVFYRGDRARILKYSAYSTVASLDGIGVPPGCFLRAAPDTIAPALGAPRATVERHGEQLVNHFPDRGLDLVIEAEAIQVFDVFGPLSAGERSRYDEALRKATTPPHP